MTKSQIAAKIAEIEGIRDGYQSVKDKLSELKDELTAQKTSLEENVLNPIIEPYPLAGESGEDWIGLNYTKAEEHRTNIGSALSTYDGEIDSLLGEIAEAMRQLQEKIDELNTQLRGLEEDYKNAPDEEPEDENGDG